MRKVLCVNTGKIYPSVTSVARELNKPLRSICRILKNKSRLRSGDYLIYSDEANQFKRENGREIELNDLKKSRRSNKAVLCIELNEVFLSIKKAAEKTGADGSYISLVCRGKAKTAGGYHWIYEADAKKFEEENGREINVRDFEKTSLAKPIFCLELNKEYSSIRKAAIELGIPMNSIVCACKGRLKTAGKYHWAYISDVQKFKKENNRQLSVDDFKKSKRLRPVCCIELNKKFSSIKEAADTLGLSYMSIANVCRGKLKTAGGYHWKYFSEVENNKVD